MKAHWCPRNGRCGGMPNGACEPSPKPDCKHCGAESIPGLGYCPSCFRCDTCGRIIKRKFIPKEQKS